MSSMHCIQHISQLDMPSWTFSLANLQLQAGHLREVILSAMAGGVVITCSRMRCIHHSAS